MNNTVRVDLQPNEWISKYYEYFFYFTKSKISDTYIVEEIIQETFLSALKSMANYKYNASEKTWLVSILKHKIIDYYRKSNTTKGKIERFSISDYDYKEVFHKELSEEVYDDFYNQNIEDTDYIVLKEKILSNLENMPKKQAEVFKMKIFHNFELETISEKLGISKGNVCVLMYRAKKKLSSRLGNILD